MRCRVFSKPLSYVQCEATPFFYGATNILLAADYLHCWDMPGFLLSLDLCHTYDHVSIQLLERVPEDMDFGVVLRHWIATLHRPPLHLLDWSALGPTFLPLTLVFT